MVFQEIIIKIAFDAVAAYQILFLPTRPSLLEVCLGQGIVGVLIVLDVKRGRRPYGALRTVDYDFGTLADIVCRLYGCTPEELCADIVRYSLYLVKTKIAARP
jgi:hypothetical protein